MKKLVVSLSLLVSAVSFGQSCCNVVDSSGRSVVDKNGDCITAKNIPSGSDCSTSTVTKTELEASEKDILTEALEGVKFKSNSDELLPESYAKLDAVAEVMKNNSTCTLTIDGYTDNTGKSDYNHKLSDKRAKAAKARLIEDGIDGSRITTHGYGEENPIATNDTPAGRAKNRRVEFKISF